MGNYPHHIQIIADSNTWIEGNAVAQLETTARLPHMLRVAGMPDLHAGRGYPVGAAFFSDRHFYPALIGNDIGCGMAFWQTNLRAAKLKPAKLAKQLGRDLCKKVLFTDSRDPNKDFRLFLFQISTDSTQIPP